MALLRLTSAAEDYFDRFCSVELQVVSLSPLRDMFKFSLSVLDIAGRYYDVRLICILSYTVTLYNRCQITSVYKVRHWTVVISISNV